MSKTDQLLCKIENSNKKVKAVLGATLKSGCIGSYVYNSYLGKRKVHELNNSFVALMKCKNKQHSKILYRSALSTDSGNLQAIGSSSTRCREIYSNHVNRLIIKSDGRKSNNPLVMEDDLCIGIPVSTSANNHIIADKQLINNYKTSVQILNSIENELSIKKTKLDLLSEEEIQFEEDNLVPVWKKASKNRDSNLYMGVYLPSPFWLKTSYNLSLFLSILRLTIAGNYKRVTTYKTFKRKTLEYHEECAKQSGEVFTFGKDRQVIVHSPDWLLFLEKATELFSIDSVSKEESMCNKMYSGSYGIRLFFIDVKKQIASKYANPTLRSNGKYLDAKGKTLAKKRIKELGISSQFIANSDTDLSQTYATNAVKEFVKILEKGAEQ